MLPRELLQAIALSKRDIDERAAVQILEDVFWAGCTTEEGRQTRIAVTYVSPENAERLAEPLDRRLWVGPPGNVEPFSYFQFEHYRNLSAQELRRLSPSAPPDEVLVCVYCFSGTLQIHGLLTPNGEGNFEFGASYTALLPTLTVRSTGPGTLHVYSGPEPLASLGAGKVTVPGPKLLYAEGVVRQILNADKLSFGNDVQSALRKAGASSKFLDHPDYLTPKDYGDALDSGLSKILQLIAKHGHGGALIMIGSPKHENEYNVDKLATIKYKIKDCRSPNELFQWRLAKALHFDLLSRVRAAKPPSNDIVEELHQQSIRVSEWQRKLGRSLSAIANFSQVDGATIVRTNLAVVGYGAVLDLTYCPEYVYSTRNPNAPENSVKECAANAFGTRHRSAFSFVNKAQGAIAFIASSDGGIRCATRVADRVLLWEDVTI